MPIKQDPILKNWLKIGAVAFCVSFGCALIFNHNLAQSAMIGLATIPGVVASMVVKSRQRQQKFDRQLVRDKLRLHELQRRGEILTNQVQMSEKDRHVVEVRVQQLHDLVASLNTRIDRDQAQSSQLEQQLAILILREQEQQTKIEKLDTQILDKQAIHLELATELAALQSQQNELKLSRDRSETTLRNVQVEIDKSLTVKRDLELYIRSIQIEQNELKLSRDRSEIKLKNVQAEIDKSLTVKRDLELHIQNIQTEQKVELENHQGEMVDRQLVLQDLESTIHDQQQNHQALIAQVGRIEQDIQDRLQTLKDGEQNSVNSRSQLQSTELELSNKQAKLAELESQLMIKFKAIEASNQKLQITQLELTDRQAELDNLESKIYAKLEEMDAVELDLKIAQIEPQPPLISRSVDDLILNEKWHDNFIDNPHLAVLEHIEKHGAITEAEASSKLGNARSVRQFANKLEEYTQSLPFAIRVESSAKGNRYLKESHH